jgi:hypothetical protein
MGRKKDKKTIFKEISDNFLSDLLLNEYNYIIDDYLTQPNSVIHTLEGSNLISKTIGCKTHEFNNFLEVIEFIEKLRSDNYFFIHRINVINKKVILRCDELSLNERVFGLEHIRLQRLRDKKINEILE